ncbi:MAG: nucleotide exchange factor GrpE [Bacteroidales bacterium]|nr:nucleotide exchange factor GrpE [Bacteroidales bacterium]
MTEEEIKQENLQNANAAEKESQADNLSTSEAEMATAPENLTEDDISQKNTEEKEEKKSFFNRKNKKEEQLKKQIEELELQKKELNDKFLRLYSDFDNYKKRTNKEKLELIGTASEKVVVSLLPIVDDFERAIKANENLDDIQVMKDGFSLIYNKLLKLLDHLDVKEIPAKGAEFNTDYHEAVTHFPAPTEEEKGKVIDVTEKGYTMKEKVIRYAKVVVGQ